MRTNCYSDRVIAQRLGSSHIFDCNLIFMLLVAYCAMLLLIAAVYVCYCFDCLGLFLWRLVRSYLVAVCFGSPAPKIY